VVLLSISAADSAACQCESYIVQNIERNMATTSVSKAELDSPGTKQSASTVTILPRVTIRFCTQCRWMLRAAYFAQELLSTFSTALGEVSLIPDVGGVFVIELYYTEPLSTEPLSGNDVDSEKTISESGEIHIKHLILWDRKEDGGFPETKQLKQRLRNIIQPGRDLGHVDGKNKATTGDGKITFETTTTATGGTAHITSVATTAADRLKALLLKDADTAKVADSRQEDTEEIGGEKEQVICEDCQ
jgi:predicted Rdx family selenoprotein